ncbi:maintenance of mitochondrial morphology protein 1 [Coniophora puteana RWD-64-598 SS2]|uniref:Maintenance of mitochondrial morphology protein 1 n=1 Tax=Coniophora puteana (strain RWD-64-598) TaxID=741705 RepID=A0A5M3N5A9_CONPW|nr:maintenance of mitochondrial morphology protein 1 [Coniophora puteana RWD-64-598 SS2]EIW86573.1 maintenance of mitochondrial morphology protein 1 [Coniophora puteana RWD-64-598 SS2]
MAGYLMSLTPTFTQGLVLGQLSIIVVLWLILKYLFLTQSSEASPLYHPIPKLPKSDGPAYQQADDSSDKSLEDTESAEWFNMLAQQITEVYRSKLRQDTPGDAGDEIARQRIEEFANKIRPVGLLDHISVHTVDLGISAPQVSNARVNKNAISQESVSNVQLDVTYTDVVSISLSTAYLFNYPMPSFARLPVSITIALSLFQASIILTTPAPSSPIPTLTFSLLPDFTLDVKTSSLMGSRAMLKDVPKLHELIQQQIHRVLATRGVWSVVLPGLSTVKAVKEELLGSGS